MTPLNLYLENASEQQVREALEDYGLAIKQLAAANIFPGDMLLKNFGVTRHGFANNVADEHGGQHWIV